VLQSVVVVGASLAGLRAAETLRRCGFDGRVTVVGAEPCAPYDRPPLSKQFLSGEWDAADVLLQSNGAAAGEDPSIEWVLGTRATGVDRGDRTLTLDNHTPLRFDGLVIATGARPRMVPAWAREGVHALRTLDDAIALRADLDRTPGRVVVVGAGFIGAEVAATCRQRGLAVTMVEPLPTPLGRVLGQHVGQICAELHRDHGVDLRLGTGVAGIDGGRRVEAVRLADGSSLPADVVVVGIGAEPVTEWLAGSGIPVDDGVVCDETCAVAPGVVAAGDVARWRNARFDEMMRVEHWENAQAMAEHAVHRLLGGVSAAGPYTPVPWFWSDQYDRTIQMAGRCAAADEVVVVDGSLEDRRFVALYRRGEQLAGVLGFNRPRQVLQYRKLIAEGAPWADALSMRRTNGQQVQGEAGRDPKRRHVHSGGPA
jgi:3-phenylpropionate/trans-cinnamate dioxygenase ferredoxin reductase subunit